ncbi:MULTISPECIES: DNA polymerase III subunit delta' [Pacificibacter]|uniref:DNA polymerase III subunit delta' n=1 Tax=Pacificibacter TaxID=1042323 RepID=UPI001C09F701|nr:MULTISPECIES: DNA polymerase III subunit delta' [Pacificibacter]MBU2935227.1 DNA polymerase III subunit delta' [Pacificibacter marinus]MDO6615381.1 DNA polymerase III subunit delta' [Pacificibacter sp. 1_MG-2023]
MRAPAGDMELEPEADRAPGAPHPRETLHLFGQSNAEDAFLQAFNTGRLHHAWLITGPRGVGKATLAWRIARFLLSQPVGEADAGLFGDAPPAPTSLEIGHDTPVYRRSAQLAEPRLCLIRRAYDAKKGKHTAQISVEEVRKLGAFFHMSATDGGRRVVIVDSADDMNVSSANALLKMLEEPPKDAVLLLVSHQPSRLLPTIRSRCRELRLGHLGGEDVRQALDAAGFDAADQSDALAELAAGSVGEALRLTNLDGMDAYREVVALFATLPKLDRPRALKLAESCVGAANVDRYELILGLIDRFLTRMARTGAGRPPLVEAARGEAEVMRRLAPDNMAAKDWATVQQEISARAAHAKAVNLDPAASILDMVFKINDTASRVARTR